jgi:hypothetical protein
MKKEVERIFLQLDLVKRPSERHTNRVTRLNEFSPINRLFTFGSFLKITEQAHIFVLGKSYIFILTKIRLHFGRFLHKLIRSPCTQNAKIQRCQSILNFDRIGTHQNDVDRTLASSQ